MPSPRAGEGREGRPAYNPSQMRRTPRIMKKIPAPTLMNKANNPISRNRMPRPRTAPPAMPRYRWIPS